MNVTAYRPQMKKKFNSKCVTDLEENTAFHKNLIPGFLYFAEGNGSHWLLTEIDSGTQLIDNYVQFTLIFIM